MHSSLQAQSLDGNGPRVSISGNNLRLNKIIKEIKRQTRMNFFYATALVEKFNPININISNATVPELLNECFRHQPQFTYKIVGNSVVITIREIEQPPPAASSPRITINGRVVDEKGNALEGVTVSLKGSYLSTYTTNEGEFTLKNVERDATIFLTSINTLPLEIALDGKLEPYIVLRSRIGDLGKVTVFNTGIQQLNRGRSVGSFSKLDSINFHRRAGMDIIGRMDGTMPGVLFNKKGSTLISPVQVRGIITLGNDGTSTAPLIVVDNFPMPEIFNINNINANDVESITILKDAAAASIWGSRAGNGVMVITTKKGKYDQPFQLNLSSNITIAEKPDLDYYPRIDASEFIGIEKYLFDRGFYDSEINNRFIYPVISPVVEILARRRAGLISDAAANGEIDALKGNNLNADLDRYLYRPATRQQYYLEMSGGTEKMAYRLSAGHNRNMNNLRGSRGEEQYTFKTNAGFKPVKNLDIQAGIDFSTGNDRSAVAPAISPHYPYTRLVNDAGNPVNIPFQYREGYIDTAGKGILLDWHYNPLKEIRHAAINISQKFFRFNAALNYKISGWAKVIINYQYQSLNLSSYNLKSIHTWETRDLINRFTNPYQSNPALRHPVPVDGILDLSNSHLKQHNLRGLISLSKTIKNRHYFTALAGAEISDTKGGYGSYQRIYGYNDQTGSSRANVNFVDAYPLVYAAYPGNMQNIPNNSSFKKAVVHRFVSMVANAGYVYDGRYSIYMSARKDGANIFGVNTNNRWKPLWSVGSGWEISREAFYELSWMPFLKLRSSYGYTGNSSNYLSGVFIINHLDDPDPITNLPVSQPGRAPNPDLKWEEVRITNIGLDFQLFNGRIAGSMEVFNKRSGDVIADAPMAPSSGVYAFTLNFASLRSTGYELVLNTQNIQGRFSWATSFAWSHAKTVVTKIHTPHGYRVSDFLAYDLNAAPGRLVYGLSSYLWEGLDPATGDPQGRLNKKLSKNYNAILNDSIQNQVFHGSSLPLNSFYFRNNFSFRNFTLSVNITGRFSYFFREPALSLDYAASFIGTSYSTDYYRRWQKPGDELFTHVPSMPYHAPAGESPRNQFYRYASIHVKRADNIRLQDISLSWQWKSLRLYFYPNNLNIIIWRAEKSRFDPDFSGGSGNLVASPPPRTWTFGIRAEF